MHLKTFKAQSMTEAMRKVKAAMGEDAIIVSTRSEDDHVRVTAVLDKSPVDKVGRQEQESDIAFAFDDQADETARSPGRMMEIRQDDQGEPSFEVIKDFGEISRRLGAVKDYGNLSQAQAEQEIMQEMTRSFLRHGLSSKLSDRLLSTLESGMSLNNPREALSDTLEMLFRFEPIPTGAHEKPLMVVGEPGAGKTLTTAKLAARAVMNDLTPCVISFDTVRAGGIEQLAAFTTILKLPLIKVNSPEQLLEALRDHADADQIIIDSPGVNPFDQETPLCVCKGVCNGSRAGDAGRF